MTKIPFTRFRGSSERDFFDPSTDILNILPVAVRCALNMTGLKDEAEIDADYMISCWRVFELRLREDETPVSEQVDAFVKAMQKVPEERRQAFYSFFAKTMLFTYALFLRAQSELKRDDLAKAFTFAEVGALQEHISKDTLEAVMQDLKNRLPEVRPNVPVADGSVGDDNGDVLIDNVKTVASCLIPCNGDRNWDALSKAADDWFNKLHGKQAIAVALAYPNYDLPCMRVEVPEEELADDALS